MAAMIMAVERRCLQLGVALVLMSQTGAWADGWEDFHTLRQKAADYVVDQANLAYPDAQAKVEIGLIDPRLRLPKCPEAGFAIASGSALWSSGNLAVSCSGNPSWSLYVTYQTRLKGPALVARRPMPIGTAPGPADLVSAVVDYDADPDRYLRNPAALRGAVLTRPVAKDGPITVDSLRIRPVIRPGQRVQIRVDGRGFEVSQEGIAQSQAGIGDSLRLKTASGRYVQGVVQDDGTVRINP